MILSFPTRILWYPAHRKKLEREKSKLVKQQAELQAFDEKLRHYPDQRISLDRDDGVKINYCKFGINWQRCRQCLKQRRMENECNKYLKGGTNVLNV